MGAGFVYRRTALLNYERQTLAELEPSFVGAWTVGFDM